MKQITIRGIGTDLHNILKHEAERRDVSINRLVLSILQGAFGLGNEAGQSEMEFHDLDHLAGTWTQQEMEEFEQQLLFQRSIDEELWQ